jgi:hypothetical protein
LSPARYVLPAAALHSIHSLGIFWHTPVLPFPFAAGGAALSYDKEWSWVDKKAAGL